MRSIYGSYVVEDGEPLLYHKQDGKRTGGYLCKYNAKGERRIIGHFERYGDAEEAARLLTLREQGKEQGKV